MIDQLLKSYSIGALFLILYLPVTGQVSGGKQLKEKRGKIDFTSELVNDKQIRTHFLEKAEELYNSNQFTPFKELNEQIYRKSFHISAGALKNEPISGNYKEKREGVVIIGKIYKCSSCPKNHLVTASAFVIGKEGLCVTNNHVFSLFPNDSNTYLATFIMDNKGNVYPVEEVLAASKENDIALFKVNTNGVDLLPLSLGSSVSTGDEVSIVSHPDSQYYTYTKGYVSRKYAHPLHQTSRLSITAEFAKGSSGAPVFGRDGKVVGIVSATRSIYYKKGKNLQMVVREVIPVEGLKELMTKEKRGKKRAPGKMHGSTGLIP